MIIVVGGIKGGSGKTTLATNLASYCSRNGKRTLLIDADEQHSASDWAEQRSQTILEEGKLTTISLHGKAIYQQISKLRPDYEEIIIDVGGRDTTSQRSALAVADKFLVPFKPRSFDIWTIGNVRKLIEDIQAVNQNLKCYYIINQGDSTGLDNAAAMEIISEIPSLEPIPNFIGHRKAFSNAAAEGLSVWETKCSDKKACQEMLQCASYLYQNDIISTSNS
jgi:chromosome partitioning protein